MPASQDVLWALTKRNNAFLVKFGTRKQKQWSHDPTNLTGFHSASNYGSNVGVQASRDGKRHAFTVIQKHATKNGIKKVTRGPAKIDRQVTKVLRSVNGAAKLVQNLNFETDKSKRAALKRLGRANYALRDNVPAAKATKSE